MSDFTAMVQDIPLISANIYSAACVRAKCLTSLMNLCTFKIAVHVHAKDKTLIEMEDN